MEKANVNGTQCGVRGQGIRRAGPADQHGAHRGQLPAAVPGEGARRLPLDPVPSAGPGRSSNGRGAGELRGACGRCRGAARPSRCPSRARRRPLDRGAHRPAAGRRSSRPRSDAGPSRAAAGGRAERGGFLREGRACPGGLRRGRPRGGDGAVPERRLQSRLGNLPEGDRASTSRRRGAGDGRTPTTSSAATCPPSAPGSSGPIKRPPSPSRCSPCWARRAIAGSSMATSCSTPGSRRSRTAGSRAWRTCCTCSARSRWPEASPGSSPAIRWEADARDGS